MCKTVWTKAIDCFIMISSKIGEADGTQFHNQRVKT